MKALQFGGFVSAGVMNVVSAAGHPPKKYTSIQYTIHPTTAHTRTRTLSTTRESRQYNTRHNAQQHSTALTIQLYWVSWAVTCQLERTNLPSRPTNHRSLYDQNGGGRGSYRTAEFGLDTPARC